MLPHVWDTRGGFLSFTSITDISTALMRPRRPKQYCLQLYIYIYIYFFWQLIFKRFFSGKSETDCSTLYSDRTLINHRNVKAEPQTAYRADRDFLILVVKSRVIVAAMEELGFAGKSSQPTKCPIPENLMNQSKIAKLQFLHKAASLLVDKFVLDNHSLNSLLDEILTAQQT